MATLVGMQGNFVDAVKELVELEYDAVEAYEAALNRLTSENYKSKLEEFTNDHRRHIQELSDLLTNHGEVPPHGPSAGKQWLTKGKVVLANLIGDDAILLAMRSNEVDTNTAYERMDAREDRWEDSKDVIRRAREDEIRHKTWLDQTIST